MPKGYSEWEPQDLQAYTDRRIALNALMNSVRGSTVRAAREMNIPASIVSGIRTGRQTNEAKLTLLEEWAKKALTPPPAEAPEHLQHAIIAL